MKFNRNSAGKFVSKAWAKFVFSLKLAFLGFVGVGMILAILQFKAMANGVTVNNTVQAAMVATSTPSDPPVMKRIAACESKNSQKGKSGQVQMHVNTNGTVDIGLFEINTGWFSKATELSYDLTTEKGNHDFAMWLYANYGTEPWYSSKQCWSK